MTLTSATEGFLIESSELISPRGTDLDGLSSRPDTQSFHSTLLDDFQLDLELECEEDGSTVCAGNDITHSWNSHTSPTQFCLPLQHGSNELSGEHQKAYPTISELINTNFIDLKEEEVYLNNEADTSTRRISSELCEYNSQAIPTPSVASSPLISLRDESQGRLSPGSNQGCVICPLCQILFSSLQSLLLHFSEQHSKVKMEPVSHQCSVCGKYYASKKNLVRHTKSHTIPKNKKIKKQGPFSCPTCPYMSHRETLLQQHLKNKHDPDRDSFQCCLCPFSCIQEKSLKVHMLRHEGVEGKFACDQCGKLFFTMSILKRHARTHNATMPYVCDFETCNKTFNIKSRLTDHIKIVHHKHSESKQRKVEIIVEETDCQQQVDSSTDELQRKVAVDSTKLASASEFPPVLIKDDDAVILPPSQIQNNEDKCNGDNDTTPTIVYDIILPNDTLNHFHSGADNSKSASTMCLKSSDSGSPSRSYVVHEAEMKVSRHEKKFLCSWSGCGKRFRDSYNLRKHMCTHTGEMERACPLCRYQCVQKSAMDKHMKTHKNCK